MPNSYKQYRNRELARTSRNKERKKYYKKTAIYEKHKWKDWEDELVMERKMTDPQLSKLICRSVQSIQARRWRLRKENRNAKSDS